MCVGAVTQDREGGDLMVGILCVELAEVAPLVLQTGIGEADPHPTWGELLELEALVFQG